MKKYLWVPLLLSYALATENTSSQDNKKNEDNIVLTTEKEQELSGLGNHTGDPQGTPFTLPEGIELVEPIQGMNDTIEQ